MGVVSGRHGIRLKDERTYDGLKVLLLMLYGRVEVLSATVWVRQHSALGLVLQVRWVR